MCLYFRQKAGNSEAVSTSQRPCLCGTSFTETNSVRLIVSIGHSEQHLQSDKGCILYTEAYFKKVQVFSS
jgi:hypothetical protein